MYINIKPTTPIKVALIGLKLSTKKKTKTEVDFFSLFLALSLPITNYVNELTKR
jgi:hypothetical protein